MSEVVEQNQFGEIDKRERTSLIESRARIISSVMRSGLRSAHSLEEQNVFHLPSSDSEAFWYIEGCVINPQKQYPDGQSFDRAIDDALYEGDPRSVPVAIMPVLMERRIDFEGLDYFYDPKKSYYRRKRSRVYMKQGQLAKMNSRERKVAEERMHSSFLVVYKTSDLDDVYPTMGLADAEVLPSDKVEYLVFPRKIYDQYLDSGLVVRTSTPIKVVDEYIERSVFGLTRSQFKIPNYKKALEEVLEEIGESIWVHGVRLPTQNDLDNVEVTETSINK